MGVLQPDDDRVAALCVVDLVNEAEGQINNLEVLFAEQEPVVGHHERAQLNPLAPLEGGGIDEEEVLPRERSHLEAILLDLDLKPRNGSVLLSILRVVLLLVLEAQVFDNDRWLLQPLIARVHVLAVLEDADGQVFYEARQRRRGPFSLLHPIYYISIIITSSG